MEYVLRTFDLSKMYKRRFAVNHANMNVLQGDIYGFVGENGSGKTTIIRLITGLIYPNSGGFELFGVSNTDPDITKARKNIGAIVETPSIYSNMSATDNLMLQCNLLGIENKDKVKETLEIVGLSALYGEKKAAGDFSLGMRQRLGIAMALIGDPKFIILDEPMNGLDPAGIVEVRELILKLNREFGITFLISSHILSELALVATRYGIISKGSIIKEISSEELHNICRKYTLVRAADMDALWRTICDSFPEYMLEVENGYVKISGDIDLNLLFAKLLESKNQILSINCRETSFEEYYLSLAGGKRND